MKNNTTSIKETGSIKFMLRLLTHKNRTTENEWFFSQKANYFEHVACMANKTLKK